MHTMQCTQMTLFGDILAFKGILRRPQRTCALGACPPPFWHHYGAVSFGQLFLVHSLKYWAKRPCRKSPPFFRFPDDLRRPTVSLAILLPLPDHLTSSKSVCSFHLKYHPNDVLTNCYKRRHLVSGRCAARVCNLDDFRFLIR